MQFAKRISLFLMVNILVMITISIVLNLVGARHYATANGLNYDALMVYCLVWGMTGSFISLALSRVMAKWMMGVQVLDPHTNDARARWLVDTVHRLAKQSKIRVMPEVGIYNSPDLNAFATGPTKNRSLVAVSSGLLNNMSQSDVEGVLGHEMSHISNGDMVTMTLIQGVVNAFTMFLSRIIAFAISQNVREESRFMVRMIVTIVLDILLTFLGYMVVAYFSRRREFRADKGGARLTGKEKMIGALNALQKNYGIEVPEQSPSIQTLKISGKRSGFMQFFSTHPPLEERIRRLQSV
jgi:heat shock protein HtpX